MKLNTKLVCILLAATLCNSARVELTAMEAAGEMVEIELERVEQDEKAEISLSSESQTSVPI